MGEVISAYPEDYIKKYEVFDKMYLNRAEALTKAKELRCNGWNVTVKKYFGERVYFWVVKGERERKPQPEV